MKVFTYLSIIGLFFLVIILTIIVSFLQYRQIIRQNAAGPTFYGNCASTPSNASGVCSAQPNTCASFGSTQYSTDIVPPPLTICAINAKNANVPSGTNVFCCPGSSGYTHTYGNCGSTNQGTCTTDTCIGTPLTTEQIPTDCAFNGYNGGLSNGTRMYCCSAPLPTPTADPCSTLQLNSNCLLDTAHAGLFCGGNAPPSNCNLGGSTSSLYSCQCDAQGRNCHQTTSQDCTQSPNNACIVVPGGINADHCGVITGSNLAFSLNGIGFGGNTKPVRKTRAYKLLFAAHGANGTSSGGKVTTVSSTGIFDAVSGAFIDNKLSVNGIQAGQYDILLHVDGYLDKKLTDVTGNPVITITGGQPMRTKMASLTGGDIAPNPIGDNFIDIQDYNAMFTCMSTVCPNRILADLNDDGLVNDIDMQLLLNAFGSIGDSFSTPQFTCVTDPTCGNSNGTMKLCSLKCTINPRN